MNTQINIKHLPAKAQDELIDFYEFLVEKYVEKKTKPRKGLLNCKEIDNFFDKYNLDLRNYSFNRDEIYER